MAEVRWTHGGLAHVATWRSEAGVPAPTHVALVDDRTRADEALRRIRRGEQLLYVGDFQNARQLLASLGRRLEKSRRWPVPRTALEAFRQERQRRGEEHALLSRLLVPLDDTYTVALRRGPKLRDACEPVWGPPAPGTFTVVALRELLGMVGAAEWRKKGVRVEGLPGPIHPHYGVFSPTRPEYTGLIRAAPAPTGKRVFEIGTGTGVLSFLLLARGASEVVATDIDPRAVACAAENAERLGFGPDRFRVLERPLFPDGQADLVVCNPPWIPERPKTRIDRAIYDEDSAVLRGFFAGLADHLAPGGQGWLILSDLPELIGLREAGWLNEQLDAAGLRTVWRRSVAPQHPRAKDPTDPLHRVRSRETTRLYALEPIVRRR
ncbi:MAG: class I SAM-dependent methyltransferase [Myxococcaceae bacterium]|nr:class I SAM-dependent methyltransferase [Myxococcaceae bacterium]